MKKSIAIMVLCIILSLCGCQSNKLRPSDSSSLEMPKANSEPAFESLAEGELLSVEKETVSAVVTGLVRPVNYVWQSTVEYRSGDSRLVLDCSQYVKGDRARLESYVGSKRQALYITDGRTLYSYGKGSAKPYKSAVNMGTDYDTLLCIARAGIALPDDINKINATYLTVLDGEYAVFFEVADDEIGILEKFWLSLDSGVPLRAESYIDGKMCYLLKTVSFENTEPSDDIFKV